MEKEIISRDEETVKSSDLIHEIEQLNEEVHKQNSRWRIFGNGIISGLGRAIGATVLFAIIIATFSYIVDSYDVPWFEKVLTWLSLGTYLNI